MNKYQKILSDSQGKYGNMNTIITPNNDNSGLILFTDINSSTYQGCYKLDLINKECSIKILSNTLNEEIKQINIIVFDNYFYGGSNRVIEYTIPLNISFEDFLFLLKQDKFRVVPA